MKPDPNPIDRALDAYAQESLPACPDRLISDVWREIDNRRRQSVWTRLFPLLDWNELFREPRLALSAVGLALAVGLIPAFLQARPLPDTRLARESLHFEVFSSQAPLAMLAGTHSASSRGQP